MSNYSQIPLEPYGVVSDTDPFNVESEWTSVNNMRFNDLAAEKIGGEVQAIATTEQPYFLQYSGDHLAVGWFYMGDGTIRLTDLSTDTDLDVGNNVGPGTTWDSSLFNNIPIFNNIVQTPLTWTGTGDVTDLPAFPVNTLCQAIRPYRSFLVALNITESSVLQENRVIWSDSSDAGALPASWDITDPTTLAGDNYLTSSKAQIIDGLQLRDLFVIYKTHAIHTMRLVGGQSTMKFEKIHINSGLLAKNCVQEFKGMHFVVSDGDIVLFDGQSIKSIADKRVRSTIFGDIDPVNFRNSYVARYDRQDEMWVCYPTRGNTWANKAAIWNWKDDTWTFIALNESRHIASGQANKGSFTYDSPQAAITYDSPGAQIPYAPISDNPTTDTLVSATSGQLGILDDTFDSFGIPMVSSLEKRTMDLGSDSVKIVKSISPRITAATGTIVYIRVGYQFHPDDEIIWSTEQQYIVGVDRKSDFTVKGRYISVRFRTQDLATNWKLHSFFIDAAQSGQY